MYEAARLIVRNNTIEGSLFAAAFVGVDLWTSEWLRRKTCWKRWEKRGHP
jgi:hypothetical protein